MANIRLIKRRIRSVTNTAKITKAMEMIATSKMRRAQLRNLASRPYADKMREVLANLAAQRGAEEIHPLLQRRPVNSIAIIHIAADRGLCGGFNTNLNRHVGGFILEQQVPVSVISVGRKGRDFMVRYGRNLRAEFTRLGDFPGLLDTTPVALVAMDEFLGGAADAVYISYNHFISTMTQKPTVVPLLPVQPAAFAARQNVEYIYEPSSEAVLAELLPRYVEMQVYHAVLESIASEQSARMVAMRSATDSAKEMIQDLTLIYNKARQEMITKELLDIAGAAAIAVEK